MDSVETSAESNRLCLFSNIPICATRLVCKDTLEYSDRIEVRTPTDAAAFLRPYFKLHDCEEFLSVHLITAGVITELVRISKGGLAGSAEN